MPTGGGSVASQSECSIVAQRLRLSKDAVFSPRPSYGASQNQDQRTFLQLLRSARGVARVPRKPSPRILTKVECHSSTAICSTGVSFGDALSEPDLLSRIECLNTESASRTALAFEAVAHGDADGVPSNGYLELSATACGFAIRHVDYLSTETHNRPRPTIACVREHSFLHLNTPARTPPIRCRSRFLNHESVSMESIGLITRCTNRCINVRSPAQLRRQGAVSDVS
jgi:hypothetical protein